MIDNDLIKNIDKIHTTELGTERITRNLELETADVGLMGKLLFRAQELAQENGCAENGARFVINCKSHGGQTVDHIHCHVLGGRFMLWPPG